MRQSIIDNTKAFQRFSDNAISIFKSFNAPESRHHKFEDTHMLCICPGGRAGGTTEGLIEIFWGRSMPYKSTRHIKPDFSIGEELLHETGGTLLYSMDEWGRVVVIAYPPETKNTKPVDQGYLLDAYSDASRLNDIKRLRRHWKYFNSLMQVHSLFGAPNLIDKLRVFWMRYFKKKLQDNRIQNESAFVKGSKKNILYIGGIILTAIITAVVTTLITTCRH